MKKLVFLFLLIFPCVYGESTIYIDSPTYVNGIFYANVSLNPSQSVMGVQFDVEYENLFAINISKEDLFEHWINDFTNFTIIDNENGTIKNIIAFSFNETNESGVVVMIKFLAVNEGVAHINLTNVVLSDENGNEIATKIINKSIFVDLTPPSISLLTYPNNITNKNSIKFEWTSTENCSYSYMLKDTWSPWNYSDSKTFNLTDGEYTFKIKAKDLAGNIGYLNYSFKIDTIPPSISNITVLIGKKVNISCIARDNIAIKNVLINIGNVTMTMNNINNSLYYYNNTYSGGSYKFYIYAIDLAGNWNKSKTMQFNINKPPVATNDNITIDEDTSIKINVLSNDYDEDGDVLAIVNITSPSHGTASHDNKFIYYTPSENYFGKDSFVYYITDGKEVSNATVYITINPVNDPPVASFSYSKIDEQIEFISNSYDIDGYIVIHEWDFENDGVIDAFGKKVLHLFKEGNYTVVLRVIDNEGKESKISKNIKVRLPDFILKDIYYEKGFLKVIVGNEGGYAENVNLSIFINNHFYKSKEINISYKKEKEIEFLVKEKGIKEIKAIINADDKIKERNKENNEKIIKISAPFYFYYFLFLLVPFVVLLYLLKYKKKKVIEEYVEEKCIVCFGKFKEKKDIVRCSCGAMFHKSCANRVENCPECGRKL